MQALAFAPTAPLAFSSSSLSTTAINEEYKLNGAHIPTYSISCSITRPVAAPRSSVWNKISTNSTSWGGNASKAQPSGTGLYRTATLRITRTASGMTTLEGFVDGSRARGLDVSGSMEYGSSLNALSRALERRSSMGSGDLSRLLSPAPVSTKRSGGANRLTPQASLGANAGAIVHTALSSRRKSAATQRVSQKFIPEDSAVDFNSPRRVQKSNVDESTVAKDMDMYGSAWDPLDIYTGMPGPAGVLSQLQMPAQKKGVPERLQDWYQGLMKKEWPDFVKSVVAAPVVMSVAFTGLYMLDPSGLAMDDSLQQTAAPAFQLAGMLFGQQPIEITDVLPAGNLFSAFQAFMFSLSLSTGLDPTLHPVSPFAMLTANLNSMASQLMFVFLSGAVFSRLSQPSKPVQCAENIVFVPPKSRGVVSRDPWAPEQAIHQSGPMQPGVLATRYNLADPNSELVDVKVELTMTRTVRGASGWVRSEVPLELVKSGAAYQRGGMLVKHIVNEESVLSKLSEEDLVEQDAIFTLSVVGLDRTTMQSVFHVEHYPANAGRVTCTESTIPTAAPVGGRQWSRPYAS